MPIAQKRLYLTAPTIGLTIQDYDPDRPAAHCGICGATFQPPLARSSHFGTDPIVGYLVNRQLDEWRFVHNNGHNEKEHIAHHNSGRLMTPEAALKLIPLGIYPLGDLVFDEEVKQAGLEAPRSPRDHIC